MTIPSLIDTIQAVPGKALQEGQDILSLAKYSISAQGGMTALAGGAYAGATPINSYINEFTTVATTGDSCVLPPAIPGSEVTVINSGAQTLKIYAQTSNPNNPNAAGNPQADLVVALAGGAGAASVNLSAAAVTVFSCASLGRWKSQLV
jgi:hypothetical protein